MFKFPGFFSKSKNSVSKSLLESSRAVEDVVDINFVDKVASNVSDLPSYISVVDYSIMPVLWHQAENLWDALVLLDEDRNSYVVLPTSFKFKRSDLNVLVDNLQNSVYPFKSLIRSTPDLFNKLSKISNGTDVKEKLQHIKSEALTRFRGWLSVALKMGASDLHFESIGEQSFIRVRVDGEMWDLADTMQGRYPSQMVRESISSAYQNLSKHSSNSASLWQQENNSYTMLQTDFDGNSINLRFQSQAGVRGPKIVLRIFESIDKPSLSLEDLGYPSSMLEEFSNAQNTTTGVVLFCGITGSGKTTSIRAFLECHPENGRIAINTIEDPVELTIKGAHQTSVQRSFDDDDETVNRKYIGEIAAMLRMDIDIGSLGELRDSITANAWLNIGETGHMAIGTLHAHRLTGIIPRLTNKNMGLTREVICTPQTINLFVYQALVPKLCPHCSLDTHEFMSKADDSELTKKGLFDFCSTLGLDINEFRWRNSFGCSHCSGHGTKGQLLLAETLTPDDTWLALMREGKDIEAADYHRTKGVFNFKSEDLRSRSIIEHGLLKVFSGDLDLRTLSRFEKLPNFADKYVKLKNSVLKDK